MAGAPNKPPALVKVPVGLKLPRWLLDWMRQQDKSMAVLVEEALREKHGIEPPNDQHEARLSVALDAPVGRNGD